MNVGLGETVTSGSGVMMSLARIAMFPRGGSEDRGVVSGEMTVPMDFPPFC